MWKSLVLLIFSSACAHGWKQTEPFLKIRVDRNVYVDKTLDEDGEVLVKCYYTINSYLGCLRNTKPLLRRDNGPKKTRRYFAI